MLQAFISTLRDNATNWLNPASVIIGIMTGVIANWISNSWGDRASKYRERRLVKRQERESKFQKEVEALKEDKTKFISKKIDVVITCLRLIGYVVIWTFLNTTLEPSVQTTESTQTSIVMAIIVLILTIFQLFIPLFLLVFTLVDINRLSKLDRLLYSAQKDM